MSGLRRNLELTVKVGPSIASLPPPWVPTPYAHAQSPSWVPKCVQNEDSRRSQDEDLKINDFADIY